MSAVGPFRNTWHRYPTVLLDGDFPWGAIVSAPSRYGAAQQRLIVYPPGITKRTRRWLRVWRGCPLWGGVLWVVLNAYLVQAVSPWPAMVISSAVVAVAGAAAFVMAGDVRRQVRTLNACAFTALIDPQLAAGHRRLRLLATTLVTAHAQHCRGELSAVDYERIWWQVYDAMAPAPITSA